MRERGDLANPRLPAWPARGRAIGILGGSFNPAHGGHRHISLMAMKRLGLDEVWWLVSPQNPLKPVAGMAPFAERMASARMAARHPRIKVTDIEARLGTSFTADTLIRLRRSLPRLRLVWLMGADNLAQMASWRNWQQIFLTVDIAVLPRPTYCLRALAGKAAARFRRWRWPETAGRPMARQGPPGWVFLVGPLNPASATAIRARRRTTRSSGTAGSTRRGQATG
jgi:nicotinate-nucleotide adenylyltransferase